MTARPRVYGWRGRRPEAWRPKNDGAQTREVMLAASKAAVRKALGAFKVPTREIAETKNEEEVAAALAKPGVVLWQPIGNGGASFCEVGERWPPLQDVRYVKPAAGGGFACRACGAPATPPFDWYENGVHASRGDAEACARALEQGGPACVSCGRRPARRLEDPGGGCVVNVCPSCAPLYRKHVERAQREGRADWEPVQNPWTGEVIPSPVPRPLPRGRRAGGAQRGGDA